MQGIGNELVSVGVEIAETPHGEEATQGGTAAGSCYQPWARRTMRRGSVMRAGKRELPPPAGLPEGGSGSHHSQPEAQLKLRVEVVCSFSPPPASGSSQHLPW